MSTHETLISPEGEHGIRILREVDGPVDLVFRALHEPALVARWIGPQRLVNTVCTQEDRHGGTWTLVQHDPADPEAEFSFRGVVHGEPSPESTVRTFEWLGAPGEVMVEVVRLVALPGPRTRIDALMLATSLAARDGMLGSGMATGVSEGYERLDVVVADLAAAGS
ncbi:SRPBCC domain-containing protein [Nocardioides sp.]|uniref:SRPBCC domain-containing protein n=1 Tax=Nocardioides sp. TaxID=35761 RepID=UPI003517F8B7